MFKRAFVLFAEHETERHTHVKAMREVLPALEVVEPIFPSRIHVPFCLFFRRVFMFLF